MWNFRKSIIAAGRGMVQTEFDLQTNVTKLQSVFERTVRRSRGTLTTPRGWKWKCNCCDIKPKIRVDHSLPG